jgi:aspartate carbamoyltransferase catalytic subunit
MVEYRPTTPELNFRPEKIINGDFKGKDILSMEQFDPQSISKLFKLTKKMSEIAKKSRRSKILAGNLTTLLFYEPSSRTMNSFDAAMKQLGGETLIEKDPKNFSSVAKGETFEDTIRTFESYCDAIVIRHPQVGQAQRAAQAAEFIPIINAGDGIGEHPTQALLDLYTLWERFRTLSGLKVLCGGDIKNGRTVHSLLKALSLYPNNTAYLLSPDLLKLDKGMLEELKTKGLNIVEINKTEDIPKDCNAWYWTRVQKERFENPEDYEKVKNKFIVTPELLKEYGNDNMILMHPLPRVGEITEDVDKDPRAVYLRNQVRNGMYIRMALLALVLGRDDPWKVFMEKLKIWKKYHKLETPIARK